MDLVVQGWWWFNAHLAIIGGYAGIGAGVAVVVQTLKVKFHIDTRYIKALRLDGPKLVNIALTVVTLLPLVAELVLEKLHDDPTAINGNYFYVFASAVWLHRFAVSPLYGKLRDYLQGKQDVKTKAAAYDNIVAAQTRTAMSSTETFNVSVPAQPTAPADAPYDPTASVIQG